MTTIVPIPNGPLVVQGDITVLDSDQQPYDLSERPMVLLCRCGLSSTKPFCDSSHRESGFEASGCMPPQ